MKILRVALALVATALPAVSRSEPVSTVADEQIVMRQVMDDKRSVYAQNLGLSESESRTFWPLYDEYEAQLKKLDDRFMNLLNDYASKYDTLTDADAVAMLKEKMAIEKDRMLLKQKYTARVAKVPSAKKALRYAQLETRIEVMLRSQVYGIIPLAR